MSTFAKLGLAVAAVVSLIEATNQHIRYVVRRNFNAAR